MRTVRRTPRPPALWGVLIGALAGAAVGTPCPGQVDRKSTSVRHVEFSGDLDSMSAVARLDEQLKKAAGDSAGLVLLQMDGDAWRSDVVWAAGQRIRDSAVPVAVYLSDSRGRSVGAGQLMLGLLAQDCFIEARTSVRSVTGDDLRELAPDTTDFEQVTRELSGAVYTRLTDLGAPSEFADVLVGLSSGKAQSPLWVLYEPAGAAAARVRREDPVEVVPGTRTVQLIARAPDGASRLDLPAEIGARLRLYAGTVQSPSAVCVALGYRAGIKWRARVESGLSAARSAIADDLAAVDSSAERVLALLDLPDPPHAATSPQRYRRAGRQAQQEIDGAKGTLGRCERALEEFPELLRGPAPGQTAVGGTPSAYGARWRSTVQSRRDKIDKQEAKARLFAGQ